MFRLIIAIHSKNEKQRGRLSFRIFMRTALAPQCLLLIAWKRNIPYINTKGLT